MKRDLYAEVTSRILVELERGAAPWIKPWSATAGENHPFNAATSRPYSGCNVVMLWLAQQPTLRFVTFKQALELGGNVRKGEHGSKVYYVKRLIVHEKDENGDDDARTIPMMREYTVFNVAQCEALPAKVLEPKTKKPRAKDARDTLADEFVASTNAEVRYGSGEASYMPGLDAINMPDFGHSRMQTITTALTFMNWRTGPGTSRGLIASKRWRPGLAMRPMPQKN
jgi:antirestriction protein ArdC